MPKPKRGRKPKSAGGEVAKSRTYRFDPILLRVVHQFAKSQRYTTTITDVIEVALFDLLKAEGWEDRLREAGYVRPNADEPPS